MIAPGPRADECVESYHQHVGICQRAGYRNGWADAIEAIEALAGDEEGE
jgi:hypothetical protein